MRRRRARLRVASATVRAALPVDAPVAPVDAPRGVAVPEAADGADGATALDAGCARSRLRV